MIVRSGTVAHWRSLFSGQDKFVYFLGCFEEGGAQKVAFFTLSSQAKYTAQEPHCNEMVRIPVGTADFLNRPTWIQCFHEVHKISVEDFKILESSGHVNYRCELPQFLAEICQVMKRSELLNEYDRDWL